jgi:hypothetical protein
VFLNTEKKIAPYLEFKEIYILVLMTKIFEKIEEATKLICLPVSICRLNEAFYF